MRKQQLEAIFNIIEHNAKTIEQNNALMRKQLEIVREILSSEEEMLNKETPSAGIGIIGVDELAKELNLKKSAIYGLTSTGKIPHFKVGKYVRFRVEDILEWLETKRIEPIN